MIIIFDPPFADGVSVCCRHGQRKSLTEGFGAEICSMTTNYRILEDVGSKEAGRILREFVDAVPGSRTETFGLVANARLSDGK